MLRWLRSLFAWKAIRSTGVWVYCENTITGQRSAHWLGGEYQPLSYDFIRDGDIVYGPHGRYVVGQQSEIWNG